MLAPTLTFPPETLLRAQDVRVAFFDVDGVLTDGRLYYGPDGELMKAFDVKDGHGIVLVRDRVELGVISGRPGLARRRLEELRFRHLVFSQRDKLAGYAELAHLAADTVKGARRHLVETLAAQIAEDAMARFEQLHAVEVTVHKPHAPVGLVLDDIAVTARRSRKSVAARAGGQS